MGGVIAVRHGVLPAVAGADVEVDVGLIVMFAESILPALSVTVRVTTIGFDAGA
jgi:hypothetical protein